MTTSTSDCAIEVANFIGDQFWKEYHPEENRNPIGALQRTLIHLPQIDDNDVASVIKSASTVLIDNVKCVDQLSNLTAREINVKVINRALYIDIVLVNDSVQVDLRFDFAGLRWHDYAGFELVPELSFFSSRELAELATNHEVYINENSQTAYVPIGLTGPGNNTLTVVFKQVSSTLFNIGTETNNLHHEELLPTYKYIISILNSVARTAYHQLYYDELTGELDIRTGSVEALTQFCNSLGDLKPDGHLTNDSYYINQSSGSVVSVAVEDMLVYGQEFSLTLNKNYLLSLNDRLLKTTRPLSSYRSLDRANIQLFSTKRQGGATTNLIANSVVFLKHAQQPHDLIVVIHPSIVDGLLSSNPQYRELLDLVNGTRIVDHSQLTTCELKENTLIVIDDISLIDPRWILNVTSRSGVTVYGSHSEDSEDLT